MSLVISDTTADDRGIRATLKAPGREQPIEVRASAECNPASGDALTCLTLLPAMAAGGGELAIPTPVSEVLLGAVPDLVEIFHCWMGPGNSRVTLSAEVAPRRSPIPRTASFFSAGADSFYSVLTNLDHLDELYFVRGFDLPVEGPLTTEATEHARAAAAELGLPLVEVDARLRSFTDGVASWEFVHGALLATVAHALGRAGSVLVPASLDFRQFAPWGSHPATDERWGSDAVSLVSDGGVTRFDKLARIAEHDVALRHLRVCYENRGGTFHTRPPDGAFNCGRCAKCLQTILYLHLAGALERCPTLPHELDAAAWARLGPLPAHQIVSYAVRADLKVSNLRHLRELAESDPTVPDALVAEVRRLLAPFDRLDEDPGFLERALLAEDEVGGVTAAGADGLAPHPAGYRLADASSRFLARHPVLQRAGRAGARSLARLVDRHRSSSGS